jgi:hypothetical protein
MSSDPNASGSTFQGENPDAPTELGDGLTEDSPSPSPNSAPQTGTPDCPACGWGFLYPIGKTESGTLYHCFNCQRSLSKPDEEADVKPATAGTDGPVSGQPTAEQLAAMQEINPDHPAVQQFAGESAGGGR